MIWYDMIWYDMIWCQEMIKVSWSGLIAMTSRVENIASADPDLLNDRNTKESVSFLNVPLTEVPRISLTLHMDHYYISYTYRLLAEPIPNPKTDFLGGPSSSSSLSPFANDSYKKSTIKWENIRKLWMEEEKHWK